MKALDFELGTIASAKTFANNFGINVRFEGTEPVTNGNTITLPALDHTKELSVKGAGIMRGFTDHETVHCLVTDVKAGEGIRNGMPKEHQLILNACEDVRVDNAGMQLYTGMGYNIANAVNVVTSNLLEEMVKNPAMRKLENCGAFAITVAGRMKAGMKIDDGEKVLELMRPSDRALVEEVADEILKCKNGVRGMGEFNQTEAYNGFKEMANVASKAILAFQQAVEEREEDEGDGSGEGKGKGGSGSSGPGSAPGKGSGIDDGRGTDEEEDYSVEHENAVEEEAKPLNPELAGAMEEVKESVVSEIVRGMYIYPPKTKDKVITIEQCGASRSEKGLIYYNKTLEDAGAVLAVLKARMERAIMSLTDTDRESGHREGKLNRRQLVQAYQLSPTVYRRRTEEEGLDTVASLVVDMSGSMMGVKINTAAKSAILLAEALGKCGIPFEVSGFTTNQGHIEQGSSGRLKDYEMYTRTEGINTFLFKDFDVPLHRCRPFIGTIPTWNMNNNVDGESLMLAASRIRARDERKKIIIVLSDGSPAFHGNNIYGGGEVKSKDGRYKSNLADVHLYDVVRNLTEEGMHLFGIGIMSDEVKDFYPHYAVVRSIRDLPKTVMTTMTKMITGISI